MLRHGVAVGDVAKDGQVQGRLDEAELDAVGVEGELGVDGGGGLEAGLAGGGGGGDGDCALVEVGGDGGPDGGVEAVVVAEEEVVAAQAAVVLDDLNEEGSVYKHGTLGGCGAYLRGPGGRRG